MRTVAGLALLTLVAAGLGGVLVAWWLGRDDTGGSSGTPTATVAPGWPPEGTSRTVTQVRRDGTLVVTHWIHTTDPLGELDLSLPEASDAGTAEATDVVVEADGRPATGPDAVTFTSASYVFEAATRIRVRYELSGVVERSGSATGRGLATTTALDVSAVQARDTRVVRSAAVLTLACAPLGVETPSPCGESESSDEWRVELTGDEAGARVVAAVTIPS